MASLASSLTEDQKKQICSLLGNAELTLLYKASVHGYAASAFHQRCDNQGPTLVVAYNYSGYVYGGYTSKDYAQTGQYISDDKAFIFSFQQGTTPVRFMVMTLYGDKARYDDHQGPRFGDDMYFLYNNKARVCTSPGNVYMFDVASLCGNNNQLTECEVYKVTEASVQPEISVEKKPWRNIVWTAERRAELMESITSYKPLMNSVTRVRILLIGPVGVGKSSFFNSINSVFRGHVTSQATAGFSGVSVTTQLRTYTVKAGHEGSALPIILCDTMGLEELSGAGLDIDDISNIIKGYIPDRYKFNPTSAFQRDEHVENKSVTLQDKIHCIVYVLDTCKIALLPSKVEEKLSAIRRRVNSLGIPQIVLLTKVDEACPLVREDVQNIYLSSYIRKKCQEASSCVGVPVCNIIPVKNYSQEFELDLNVDILLLTAVQQMLRYADNYFEDISSAENMDGF
ncbi:interferon-induced protein 44-like [Trichomycterus rosablanca]|uniref:interferon-induced protein 44-like n=1 Tax=Trichomycterus rosablanca TaxID=2290929 RepID=UPI002F357BBC